MMPDQVTPGGMNNKGGCGASRPFGAAHGGPPSPSTLGGMCSKMPDESQSGLSGSGRQSPRAEQEEVGILLQQPLALGYYRYYVSTVFLLIRQRRPPGQLLGRDVQQGSSRAPSRCSARSVG